MPYKERKHGLHPMLNVLRWTLGGAAMVATIGYGIFKGGAYAPLLGFPVGVAMLFIVAGAFSIPAITSAVLAVTFIYYVDSGAHTAIRNTAAVLVAIGLVMSAWNAVRWLKRRDRARPQP
jgi:hypothetical protein